MGDGKGKGGEGRSFRTPIIFLPFCIRPDIFGEQLFESMNNESVATAELTWIRLSMQTSQVQVLYKLPSMPV